MHRQYDNFSIATAQGLMVVLCLMAENFMHFLLMFFSLRSVMSLKFASYCSWLLSNICILIVNASQLIMFISLSFKFLKVLQSILYSHNYYNILHTSLLQRVFVTRSASDKCVCSLQWMLWTGLRTKDIMITIAGVYKQCMTVIVTKYANNTASHTNHKLSLVNLMAAKLIKVVNIRRKNNKSAAIKQSRKGQYCCPIPKLLLDLYTVV